MIKFVWSQILLIRHKITFLTLIIGLPKLQILHIRMSQRFGDFFVDPQWPSHTQESNLSLPDLSLDIQSELEQSNHDSDSELVKIQYRMIESPMNEDDVMVKEEQIQDGESEEKMNESFCSDKQNVSINKGMSAHTCKCQCIRNKHKRIKRLKQVSLNPLKNHIKTKKTQFQRGKYKILSQQIKKKIVQESKVMTMVEVARKYHVSVNNICRWRKRCDRRSGAGRKVTDMEMECQLLEWLLKQHNPIPRKQVQQMAKRLSCSKEFKASKGWFERFYKRNKLDYNPNIQILTHNDYRLRLTQSSDLRRMQECKHEEREENISVIIQRLKFEE